MQTEEESSDLIGCETNCASTRENNHPSVLILLSPKYLSVCVCVSSSTVYNALWFLYDVTLWYIHTFAISLQLNKEF